MPLQHFVGFVCASTYLNDLGIVSGSTSDMLVTITMSVSYLQNIVAAARMSEVHSWAI